MNSLIGLVLLTIRELRSRAIIIGLFIVATLVWVILSFALNLDIVDGSIATMRILGDEVNPSTGNQTPGLESIVVSVQSFIAGAAYWVGMLLAFFSTASLIPSMLSTGEVEVLFSKPVSRSRLLTGKLIAVYLTALVLLVYLLGMVWLVMAVKSGLWYPDFLFAIVVILAVFISLYGTVTLISVVTKSSALALIVTYGLIFVSIVLAAHEAILDLVGPTERLFFLAFYHLLPNFAEVTAVVSQLVARKSVTDWYPMVSTLVFGVVCYVLAFWQLNKRDL